MEVPEIYIIKDKINKTDGKKFIKFLTSFAKLSGNFKIVKGDKWEELALEDFEERFQTDEDASYLWSLIIMEGPLKGYGGGAAISIVSNRCHKVYLSFYIDVRSQSDGTFFILKARDLIKVFDPIYLYADIGVGILLDKDGFILNVLPWCVYAKNYNELLKRIITTLPSEDGLKIIKEFSDKVEINRKNIFICFDKTLDDDTNRRKILAYAQK